MKYEQKACTTSFFTSKQSGRATISNVEWKNNDEPLVPVNCYCPGTIPVLGESFVALQMVWLVVFLATVLCGVDLGLGIGVGFSLLVIVLRIIL